MLDVLDPLSRSLANLRPYDHAQAVAAGIRSGQIRRERAARLAKAELAVHVQRVAEPDERLLLISEQIARTRKVLNDTRHDWCPACERGGLSEKDRAGLLRALCSLLDQQRIARGEPLPGSRRPKDYEPRDAQPGAWIEPEPPVPSSVTAPAPAPPSKESL